MATGDEESSSPLGALSRNWRSALVVNGLFEALEETERQRNVLAQNLSKREAGPPLFEAAENGTAGVEEASPQSDRGCGIDTDGFGRDSRGLDAGGREARKQAPPLLRHSLFAPASPVRSPPVAAPAAALPAARDLRGTSNTSGDNRNNEKVNARLAATDETRSRRHPTRRRAEARNTGGSSKQLKPPPPPERTRSDASRFRDSRGNSSRGGGGGAHGDAARARGVCSGGVGRGEEENRGDVGLSTASVGSVAGELRGGELELVRGRVADLGAAIETSQVTRFFYERGFAIEAQA
ncbi:unnamed protein product [Scytosiphon promiscuus]